MTALQQKGIGAAAAMAEDVAELNNKEASKKKADANTKKKIKEAAAEAKEENKEMEKE